MKNFLKKIGLIAIIISVLSPFITLPNVNAATTEICRYYLNQYLFMDEFNGRDIEVYEKDSDQIGKRNFTNFVYTFEKPVQGERLVITNSDFVNLNLESGLAEYYEAYKSFYGDETTLQQEKIIVDSELGAWQESRSDYENITALVHGTWAREDGVASESVWEGFKNKDDFESQTIQKSINNTVSLTHNLGGASFYNNNRFSLISSSSEYYNNFDSYMNKLISDYNYGSGSSYNYDYLNVNNGETYFNINILRGISENDLKKINFIQKNTDGSYKVLSTTENAITNSYEAVKKLNANESNQCVASEGCYLVNNTSNSSVNIDVDKLYYWPALYNIEYKICKAVTPWTLTYDRGVSSEEVVNVTNMPDKKTGITTNNVTLSSTIPTRKDYVFKAWCTEKDGKGECKEAGKVFENKEMTDKTLYAHWQKDGTEENEKQGVMSYVIGFAGIGIITYGLYCVINKKNLFKQI